MTSAVAWPQFFSARWQRRAAVLSATRPLFTTQEAFTLACELGVLFAREPAQLYAHFATGDGQSEVHPRLFPCAADQSFAGHAARMASENASTEFLLYIRGIGECAPQVLARAQSVLAPLWGAGARWSYLEIELYVGRYSWTPIGIHRESCGNFHHILLGAKEIHVWPYGALAPRADHVELARDGHDLLTAERAGLLAHPDRATYRARRGEIIYFPSECWHVGVSRSLSVSIDFALFGVCPASEAQKG